MTTTGNDPVFLAAYDALGVLRKGAPDMVADIIMLCMPRHPEPWGACSLLPESLPLLKTAGDSSLKGLLADMSNSATLESIKKGKEPGPPVQKKRKTKKSAEQSQPELEVSPSCVVFVLLKFRV